MRISVFYFLAVFSLTYIYAQERGFKQISGESSKGLYENSWAIVIGINEYQNAPKLKYAVNDAKGFANLLKTKFGFDNDKVIELYDNDATKANILKAFDKIRKVCSPEDRVIIFYAGHGVTETMGDGREKGFILPVEGSESEILTSSISTDQLNEINQLIRAKHVFFVMDACYGGLIFSRATPISAETYDYMNIITSRKARKALTAGGRDQTVMDNGPEGHSVFTYYLIDGLQSFAADLNGDGIITTSELYDYVSPRVTAESNRSQTPEYGILGGDKGGDFIFYEPESLTLSKKEVVVGIFSNVESGEVFINGKKRGEISNGKFELNLRPGVYNLEIRKEGYEKISQKIKVQDNEENNFTFNSKSLAVNLNITCSEKDAEIYLNDQKVGVGVFTGKVNSGKITVKAVKPGYSVISKNIDLTESTELSLELKKLNNFLEIVCDAPNAKATINGISYDISLPIPLEAGKYEVIVEATGYKKTKIEAIVEENKTTKTAVSLEPTIETLARRKYEAKLSSISTWRYISGGTTLASLAVVLYLNSRMSSTQDEYSKAVTYSKILQLRDQYQDLKNARNYSSLFLILCGGYYVYNLFRSADYDEIYNELKLQACEGIEFDFNRFAFEREGFFIGLRINF